MMTTTDRPSLEELTRDELRDEARRLGVKYSDASKFAEKDPLKEHWIKAILESREKYPHIWNLAKIYNPKTGRPRWIRVNREGEVYPSDAEATGVTSVPEWWQVYGHFRKHGEAKRRIAEGRGWRATAETAR